MITDQQKLVKKWLLHLSGKLKRWQKAVLAATFLIIGVLLFPFSGPPFHTDYSVAVTDEKGGILWAFLNKTDQWHLPPTGAEVPEKLKQAVISYEDQRYFSHPGVDAISVARALQQNLKNGKVISGASTITMQVARLRNPKPRTLWNKMRETLDALRLEIHFSKEEILQLYLDHAPYGGNVIGYQTASLKYFGKPAQQLTWSEAATLAVLPNAPGLIYPVKGDDRLKQKRDALLAKMYATGTLDKQTFTLSLLEQLPDLFIPFNQWAPHLARKLKNDYPDKHYIQTTIDSRVQQSVANIARQHGHVLHDYGISNLSVLVADTRTGEIKAYVGSNNFFEAKSLGQVDGVMAPRSSGSILKPFLYALSIDEGLIAPQSVIHDLPTYYDGFTPHNASEKFDGLVSAKDALIRSLNVPAVRLLNSYGVYQFYSFLKVAGVSTLFRPADDYGLPLILGGAEVNLWDMVKLYRGLANEGQFSDNIVLKEDSSKKEKTASLISPAASLLTLEMLKELVRPGHEYYWQQYGHQSPIAWKTGTSYGHKDAWAVGTTPEWTIAVWVGNFDGASNKNLGGATSAGPLLFDVFNALPKTKELQWFEHHDIDFTSVSICKESGFVASAACPHALATELPTNMRPLAICSYHTVKYTSADGQHLNCSRCWGAQGGVSKSFLTYPPDVAYYLRQNGNQVDELPRHLPQCPTMRTELALEIIYPNKDARLFIPRDFDQKLQTVVCKVASSSSKGVVFWYLNKEYVGQTTNEHQLELQFEPGWSELAVVNEYGTRDSRRVYAQSAR